ncbi:MAG: methyltransferase domain-containing protein, partial [Patescibacteria group bacterium]
FHRWLEEFSTRAERIIVIANAVGVHELPENVSVHSLGKEEGVSRLTRVVRFIAFILGFRNEYDAVLVHMTPEHAVLGGPFWAFMGKRFFLWYNHPARGLFLRLALLGVERVFYTSPESASAEHPRSERMPVGIDTTLFAPQEGTRDPSLIYMQGRVSASKRLDIALGALRVLRSRGVAVRLRSVGPIVPDYGARLRREFEDLFDEEAAELAPPIPNRLTPAEYRNAAVSVNLAREGHFDKSALEAMACGTPVIVGSRTFAGLVPEQWIVSDPDPTRLAGALGTFLSLSVSERDELGRALRQSVVREHSLFRLTDELFAAFAEPASRMDPKRFYDSVSPEKFGGDYERARWGSSPMARAQYAMTRDAIRRAALPALARARSVLELGPGPGTWTKILMEANPDAAYTLVDISKKMLDQAQSALPGSRVSFVESDWLAFVPQSAQDFFFSSRAIEYVPDKEAAARVVAHALAPRGRGTIVTKMPKRLFDRMRGRRVRLHRGQVSPEELAAALTLAGLRVTDVSIATATLPMFRSASANRALYAALKHLPLVFPLSLFAESYAISFEKP